MNYINEELGNALWKCYDEKWNRHYTIRIDRESNTDTYTWITFYSQGDNGKDVCTAYKENQTVHDINNRIYRVKRNYQQEYYFSKKDIQYRLDY